MKITQEFLKSKNACQEEVNKFIKYKLEGKTDIEVLKTAIKINELDWANWLIIRCMVYKQYVSYAVYAAKQVIDIYEKKYPNDKRPREAIEAAKKCIKNPSKENNAVAKAAKAADAADAAYAAAYAADAADAAYAAKAAKAADAAADAYTYAKKEMKLKILKYGIKLLKDKRRINENNTRVSKIQKCLSRSSK